MKLCRNCLWVRVPGGWFARLSTRLFCKLAYGDSFPSYAECSHPNAFSNEPVEIHPVTGRNENAREPFARTARVAHMPCGKDAKLFKPKS